MRTFTHCPRCGSATEKATAMNGGESTNWVKCTRCNTYINTWIPMEHQAAVLEDPHTYVGSFGGYGTGKTTADMQQVYKHIFITPNANVLIGANVMSQYEQTIKRDMENDLPAAFIKSISTQKQQWDFINGARIMWRPLDDIDKVRSYNLTMFLLLEGSEIKPEAWVQLKTRLRNMNAAVPLTDEDGNIQYDELENGVLVPKIAAEWRKGMVESNPDSGWIRSEVLYRSKDIYEHGDAEPLMYTGAEEDKDPFQSSHVANTHCNKFLPANFIDQVCQGKPDYWIRRFIYSSFDYAEGLVHPGYVNCIVQPRELDHRRWKHVVAADYGLSDDFVYLFGLIDEERGKLIIYKELVTKDKNVEQLAALYFKEGCNDIPEGGYYTTPLLDPKSGAKRDYNKKSLYDHFAEQGIAFQPGLVDINMRIFRTNTYLESGKVEIFSTCSYLIDELKDYKFKEQKIGEKWSKANDKPEDGKDHAICCLQWICCAMPADPKLLEYGAYDKYARALSWQQQQKQAAIPWQFRDDPQDLGMNTIFGEW